MLTRREQQTAIGGGIVTFASVAAFIGLATYSLLAAAPDAGGEALWTAYTARVLRFTLLQAGLSTLLSIGLAIPVALALARRPHLPGRLWILRLMALPMGLPALVAALGLITIWGRQGLVNSLLLRGGLDEPVSIYGLGGILLAHVFFNLPLACRLMVASLDRLPGEYWMLAAQLGMRPVAIFRLIEWPVLLRVLPGIAGLIFMLCATSFTLVLVLGGGPAATTLEVAIYQSLRFDFDPARAVGLSLLQIGLTAMLLIILSRLPVTDDRSGKSGYRVRRFDGKGAAARAWDTLVIAVATAFVLMPLLAVLRAGIQADLPRLVASDAFQRALATSMLIALSSGLLAVMASVRLIDARLAIADRKNAGVLLRGFSSTLDAASFLVLLVPPVVLGTGWFLLLRLSGSASLLVGWIVVAINALMAIPFVIRVLEPAMKEHRDSSVRLAASLGIGGWTHFWRIDRPVLTRPTLLAFSFAMSLSLGELGAVALFASNDFVTLPWLLYSSLSSYRTQDADGLAILLAAACLLLTMIGTSGRRMNGTHHAHR